MTSRSHEKVRFDVGIEEEDDSTDYETSNGDSPSTYDDSDHKSSSQESADGVSLYNHITHMR